MNNVIDTLQKARLLESFCGHDLRGEVGRCISFLGLLQDQLPEGASAEFREMIELSAKSARDALEQLDAKLAETSLETRYVWLYAKEFPVAQAIADDANAIVFHMKSLAALTEARRLYRPDLVFIDGANSTLDEWRALIEAIGSPLTKIVLLLPAHRREEASALENVEVFAQEQALDPTGFLSRLRDF